MGCNARRCYANADNSNGRNRNRKYNNGISGNIWQNVLFNVNAHIISIVNWFVFSGFHN